jgi:hypothetical protein
MPTRASKDLLKTTDSSPSTEELATRTRYGRVSKPPVKYEPVEQVEDDYADDDYDSDVTHDLDDVEIETDSDEEDYEEEDADEDGNLDGFVVPDKSESNDSDTDGPPSPVPVKRGAPVKKSPGGGKRVAGSA